MLGNREVLAALLITILVSQTMGRATGQDAEASTIIVTPENTVVEWEEGKEILISPVQRGNTILRPRVTVEWQDPGLAENVKVENLIGPGGDIVIRPFETEGGTANPKKVRIEWENVPIAPVPAPAAAETRALPVENVRPPDLTIPPENFENMFPWQGYVTPSAPAVRELAWRLRSIEEAYLTAVSWVWVSDRTLHGVEEKWLYPQEFLTATPNYPTNPVRGREASDCESQAYTLVSVIRAMGMPAENVRVAVGKVRFGDQVGGHAWAEIYVSDRWLPLEATSGPYWDDENRVLVQRDGLPYDYFGRYEYPFIEVWAYFNDVYYYNTSTGEGNAPQHWRTFRMAPSTNILAVFVVGAAVALMVIGGALAYSRHRSDGRRGVRGRRAGAKSPHVFEGCLRCLPQPFLRYSRNTA